MGWRGVDVAGEAAARFSSASGPRVMKPGISILDAALAALWEEAGVGAVVW